MTDAIINGLNIIGQVNYLAPGVDPSLYRNGKVLTRRDVNGSDGVREGVHLHQEAVAIRDARPGLHGQGKGGARAGHSANCTLFDQGFELRPAPLADEGFDFFSHERVVRDYYPQCAALVRVASGASTVVAFDHNLRSAAAKQERQKISGGQEVQGPARVVHGDYTLTSAPQRLRDLALPPTANDTLKAFLSEGEVPVEPAMVQRVQAPNGRFAIINVWRNIDRNPVATYPLALCDARSVDPADLVVFEIHYAERVGENYFAKSSARHKWYCYPGLTRDEALLIKQWDSAGPLARTDGAVSDSADPNAPSTFSFHTSFTEAAAPVDAPDRRSIEVRCLALYD